MIKIKSGVLPKNLTILAAVANVAASLDHDVIVTSGVDGKHMTGSLHYTYEALDIRSKNFLNALAKRNFMTAVLKRLGKGYQMILENAGKAQEHFHCEHDPN